MPVGLCVNQTALLVLFTAWPPKIELKKNRKLPSYQVLILLRMFLANHVHSKLPGGEQLLIQ